MALPPTVAHSATYKWVSAHWPHSIVQPGRWCSAVVQQRQMTSPQTYLEFDDGKYLNYEQWQLVSSPCPVSWAKHEQQKKIIDILIIKCPTESVLFKPAQRQRHLIYLVAAVVERQ